MKNQRLDCIVIGYYEPPFEEYEGLIRQYGTNSEAYRDLQFSFVNWNNSRLNFIDLLNRSYNASHNTKAEIFKSGDIPNLAAVYLTQYLRRAGLNAEYINLFIYERDRLEEYLKAKPLCVAITTTFYVLNAPVIEMVKWIRNLDPNVCIVVGGPLVANHARNYRPGRTSFVTLGEVNSFPNSIPNDDTFFAALEDMGADIYVIESQGEATLKKVIECLRNKGGLQAVPNIAYRDGKEFRLNPSVPENNTLDDNLIDWNAFANQHLGSTIQTRTARSCAFNCSFCNYPTRAGKLTLASLQTVRREMDSIRELGTVKNVVFIDDTFNVPIGRFKEFCRMMIDQGYNYDWFSYFRCSNADEEAIELAAKSGCKGVFLGIESGSPEILKNMNKAATIEKYAEGIRLLHDYGVITFGSFIMGFPGETKETYRETLDFIRENKPDYYRAQLWYCEPGTPIQMQREKYGIEGHGFVWRHATMDSLEAMDCIDKLFLSIDSSIWLPQWSFDFWIIPYLLGKGLKPEIFKLFMIPATRMLALEIASMGDSAKVRMQQGHMMAMQNAMREIQIT